MQVSEVVLIGLCNAQRDVGMLTERVTWIEWRIDQFEEGDLEFPLLKARLEMAQMQLAGARAELSKLYKEMYGE